MKFVLIPDSFKGTVSSSRVCSVIEAEIKKEFPEAVTVSIPVADGGEGTVDAFLEAVGGTKVSTSVKGPFFEDMECRYGILSDGTTAVIEMAACAGLPLAEGRKNPAETTTFGVGQLIAHAAALGVRKIIVGLGGSATNDGGCGMAAALGIRFIDHDGKEFVPVGKNLSRIASVDFSRLNPVLENIEIITMCDIENPMHGKKGAAYVFAPQKGAGPEMTELLDRGLVHLDSLLSAAAGRDIGRIPGSGAAGAMGAGMVAFLGSRLESGIGILLEVVGFDKIISDADYIITGEGLLDSQSLGGKVIAGIAARASLQKRRVIALVGGVKDREIQDIYGMGVTAVFPINRLPQDFSVSRNFSEENIGYTAANVLKLLK